eukprot:6439859-Alexandrium_andersonii.AAC.1
MRQGSIAEFEEVALVSLAGRLVSLEHVGGGLGQRPSSHLKARDPGRSLAHISVDLGELRAQLSVILIELRGRRRIDEPAVELRGGVE